MQVLGSASKRLKVSEKFEPEIAEEIKKNRERYSVNIRIVDDKIIANFNYSDNKDYADYEKVFDNMEDFTEHLEKFLGIKE